MIAQFTETVKIITAELKTFNTASIIKDWRQKICDTVFFFLSIFGPLVYIPSVVMAVREGLYGVVVADSVMYIFTVVITFSRRMNYLIRAVIGLALFYLLGVFLLVLLGPAGAGTIWLFSGSIVASLLLGNPGAVLSLLVNSISLLAVFFLARGGVLDWGTEYGLNPVILFVKTINFIFLNVVVVIINAIYTNGFRVLYSRSTETRNASIIGLAKLAEYRDIDTGEHLFRIRRYTVLLAGELAELPEYRGYITDDYIKDLEISSILHDIGKVGIQDSILHKPGSLTEEEFREIKKHPEIGASVISAIEKNVSGRSLYILGREIAQSHHEKWDGSGYPEGLGGRDIPLSARIVALADVYDALTQERPYKEAYSHDHASEIIQSGRGSHFDPDIVDAFMRVRHRFRES